MYAMICKVNEITIRVSELFPSRMYFTIYLN